ncbi:hypothetical protein [Streptomyces sp. NA04227]|uniref:hypothetical protein n=1 Tax=Streptomyces sp. NA04227 TaxID=2742136 RepID=UPI0020CA6618|nr:hypothetical protein [Streptomyces sp. NA04227]
MPAGKAMAIAAMPTAVLMGMGLTPTLAQAKPQPKNPFQDGPCVTQPDEAGKEAEDEKAKDSKTEDGKAEDGKQTGGETEPGDKPGTDEPGTDKPADDGADSGENPLKRLQEAYDKAKSEAETAADKAKELVEKANEAAKGEGGGDSAEPEPSPSPSESEDDFNPLDPLGLGKALKDLFTPDEPAEQEPAPSEPPAGEEPDSGDSAAVQAAKKALADAKAKKADATEAKKALDEAKAKLAEDAKDAADKAEDAADKAKDEATEAADKAKDAAKPGAEDPMAPDENGKKPFPCPVEKKVAGSDEQTPAQLPNQPWFLEASSLTLKGADYKGIVNVTTANGETKQVMKYIINDGVDIGDLHQTIDIPDGGNVTHVAAGKGTTSTIRGGAVTMYTERLSGNLFGLIPMTFDAEHPPPLNLPFLYFTNVKVTQAGQFGGNLTVPGLHSYITN